jgi:hypothetical protein
VRRRADGRGVEGLRRLAVAGSALLLGLTALLGLGWAASPLHLQPATTAIWSAVATTLALIEVYRAPAASDRRFLALAALCVSSAALVESLVVLAAFAPCGERCV